MVQTVGRFIVSRLYSGGVRDTLSYPKDSINGVFGASKAFDKTEFIQAQHEETTGLMEWACADFSGKLDVAISTLGLIHLVTGVCDTRVDPEPHLAIVKQQDWATNGGHDRYENDLAVLFKLVPSGYSIEGSGRCQE
jgi:thiamine pyrophosphate-dependent acetolactate synthase large subunit-like protein